jgi:hypothetical protein
MAVKKNLDVRENSCQTGSDFVIGQHVAVALYIIIDAP